MSAATATAFVKPKDLDRYDLSNYREPHPSVWATDTVLHEGWEPTAWKREVAVGIVGWDRLTFYIEQGVEQGSPPTIRIVSQDLFDPQRRAPEVDTQQSSLERLYRRASNWLEAVGFDRYKRRLRPGILELLAETMGTNSDDELAQALDVDEIQLRLARAGFTPFNVLKNGNWHLAGVIASKVIDLGLTDKGYSRNWNLTLTKGVG